MSEQTEEAASGTGAVDVGSLPGGVPAAVEAVLLVVEEPVTEIQLAAALEVPVAEVREALEALRAEYDGYTNQGPDAGSPRRRGIELRNVAGGWRFFTRGDFAAVVGRFVLEGQSARLSQAALETLAVIAYRQPVSRSRVSAIRGVNVDGVVRTLVQRGLIVDVANDPETGAVLYGTTPLFLERLGIGTVADLPKLSPHLPGLENLQDFDETTY
ncbi:segregation and condensation protein B [Arthrobacter pigmenti]|uniref:Segregation and condensation protein B n=1 Tax=Arthrobacter pigmenti TaxID=271432 RepID=A0A846RSI9_9MICC|nr:segregation and condensation protein B [Arthrobacter pigmenti]